LIFSASLSAKGAWVIESQNSFLAPENATIVGPFVDGDTNPWMLANLLEFTEEGLISRAECLFIGPFLQDDPPVTSWIVQNEEGLALPTACLSLEPGSEGGFYLRGYVVPDPIEGGPAYGFISSLDAEFNIRWTLWDDDYTELGTYDYPLTDVAWSEDRNRVLSFFNGVVNIGTQTLAQLHAMSIAENTGILREVVTDWGRASTGALQGVLVLPEDGRFLIVVHSNGTQFLIYDGLESIDEHPAGGQILWEDESVAHIQFNNDGYLFIVHYPRLDLTGMITSLSRMSEDGLLNYYTVDLGRTVELMDPVTYEMFDWDFPPPILNYITDTTATFVRDAALEYVLHTFDNFNGKEFSIQGLADIDENAPAFMADARSEDRLILVTYAINADGSLTFFVDTIAWDLSLDTPGDYPEPVEEITTPDEEGDLWALDGETGTSDGGTSGSETGGGDEDEKAGCGCAVSQNNEPPLAGLILLFSLLWMYRKKGQLTVR
jgi:hypothetical protein